MVSAERLRLDEADTGGVSWRRWGPYLSERRNTNRVGRVSQPLVSEPYVCDAGVGWG